MAAGLYLTVFTRICALGARALPSAVRGACEQWGSRDGGAADEKGQPLSGTQQQMPKGLTREERHLWRVFAKADADGTGAIDAKEFEAVLRRGHYDFSPQELSELVERVDKDRSGQLEWAEFKVIAKELQLLRVPEAGLLGWLLIFEQVRQITPLPRPCTSTPRLLAPPAQAAWGVVIFLVAPVHFYLHVGPQELWDRSDGLLSYTLLMFGEGTAYPAIRRQLYAAHPPSASGTFIPTPTSASSSTSFATARSSSTVGTFCPPWSI